MDKNSTTLLAAGVILVAATVTTLYNLTNKFKPFSSSSPAPPSTTTTPSKPISSSSITYNVRINNNQCDSKGRALGGELMMLIDVAAGLIAAKQAEGPCLTISLDRVTFLSEINSGDCLILLAAVNRSWESSMEIGVRVMKELGNHDEVYCCHAYLTFVKISPPTAPAASTTPSLLSRIFSTTTAPTTIKSKVPELIPITILQRKRYLLAGRRRSNRLLNQNQTNSLLVEFREQLLNLEKDLKNRRDSPIESKEEKETLLALQEELIVEAYILKDPSIRIEGTDLIANLPGFMSEEKEIRIPLERIKKLIGLKGKGGYRRLTIPSMDSSKVEDNRRNLKSHLARTVEIESSIDLVETFAMSAWIIRPEHCNSKNILFGGRLIRFSEEVSSIAASKISKNCNWVTASIDSLTFRSQVYPGEVVYVRAYAINTYDSSVEIFTFVTAEDRNSISPTTRLVSEAFFTLVGIDSNNGRPLKGKLRKIKIPDGPSREVADGGNKRRVERLQDKKILQRVYG